MPYNVLYAISSAGTVLSGITYKLRQEVTLKPMEWLVLSVSLALWGVLAFGMLGFYFHEAQHQLPRTFFSVPMGVGLSETFAFMVAAVQAIFKHAPDLLAKYLGKK